MKRHVFVLLCIFNFTFSMHTGEFVVTSTEYPKEGESQENVPVILDPVLYEMDIRSNISNRFAKTLVTSKVRNPSSKAQETTFSVVLPDKSFISGFVLRVGGKDYEAYVREKEEAEQIFKLAKLRGQTAGHVAVSEKNANEFKIAVNVEAEEKAVFLLTFEELLERNKEQYELVLDVHPGQVIERLNIEVHINESRPLRFVRVPSIRTSNEIRKEEDNLNITDVDIIEKNSAVIKFQPTMDEQKQFAIKFGTKESEGICGQFIVQYDVQRDPNGGEVLLQDGYFVHFFAPDNLEPIPKHIVFVLDTSGSMGLSKMDSLKDAMKNILDQLQPDDYVSLVEFNTGVYVWDLANETRKVTMFDDYVDPFVEKQDFYWPPPLSAERNESVDSAKKVIDKLYPGGGTNIIGGLDTALVLIKINADLKESTTKDLQPIVMFLTDGDPVGSPMDSTDEIFKTVTKLNAKYTGVPIFALSFGAEADKVFLRKLSLKNSGFSRHIFDGAFASIQLQNFYNEISLPLMSNITFEYADAANVTQTEHPVFFKGTEIAVCGTYDPDQGNPLGSTKIHGSSNSGAISMVPTVEKPVASLERLWAYLTVKQILAKRETANQIEQIKLKNQALEIAMKYSFVTEITSLVVVRPDFENSPIGPGGIQPRGSDDPIPVRGDGGKQPESSAYIAETSNRVQLKSAYKTDNVDFDGDYNFAEQDLVSAPSQRVYIHGRSGRVRGRTGRLRPIIGGKNRYVPATTYKPNTTSSTTVSSKLEDILPWLSAITNANGSLTIKQGTYTLGNDSIVYKNREKCARIPSNETDAGICTSLKDCPQVYQYLTDLQMFEKYFCPIDNLYVGVCCPVKELSI